MLPLNLPALLLLSFLCRLCLRTCSKEQSLIALQRNWQLWPSLVHVSGHCVPKPRHSRMTQNAICTWWIARSNFNVQYSSLFRLVQSPDSLCFCTPWLLLTALIGWDRVWALVWWPSATIRWHPLLFLVPAMQSKRMKFPYVPSWFNVVQQRRSCWVFWHALLHWHVASSNYMYNVVARILEPSATVFLLANGTCLVALWTAFATHGLLHSHSFVHESSHLTCRLCSCCSWRSLEKDTKEKRWREPVSTTRNSYSALPHSLSLSVSLFLALYLWQYQSTTLEQEKRSKYICRYTHQ